MRFGTTLFYARFHDLGTKTIPRRKLIELTPAEHHEIAVEVDRYIERGQT